MLFKRCTIGGQDFEHKPTLLSKPASMASLNLIATPGGGRTIEVFLTHYVEKREFHSHQKIFREIQLVHEIFVKKV